MNSLIHNNIIYYTYNNCLSVVENLDDKASFIYIPPKINNLPVIDINTYAFYNNHNLVNILLPDSISYISAHAFENCSSLKNIIIPPNTTDIDKFAFFKCSSLEAVYFNNANLKSIGAFAFAHCTNLQQICFPSSLTILNENCFENCTNLHTCIINKNLCIFLYNIFTNCNNLKNIYLFSKNEKYIYIEPIGLLETNCIKQISKSITGKLEITSKKWSDIKEEAFTNKYNPTGIYRC